MSVLCDERCAGHGGLIVAVWAALGDPQKLFDSDPVTNATVLALDLVGDLIVGIIESFERLLNLRLDIPYLTDFVEANVLDGHKLTVGRFLSLVVAIPTTVLYKAITGREEGPAALTASAAPQSFGVVDEVLSWMDVCSRTFDIAGSTVGGMLDSTTAVSEKQQEGAPDPMAPLSWTVWACSGVGLVLGASQLIASQFDEDNRDAYGWVMCVLGVASWTCGAAGWSAAGIAQKTENEAAGRFDTGAGLVTDSIGVITGVINVIVTAIDDDTSEEDVAVASLDLAATVGSLSAGIALPIAENTKEGISKSISAGVVVGGNVLSVGAKTSAISLLLEQVRG